MLSGLGDGVGIVRPSRCHPDVAGLFEQRAYQLHQTLGRLQATRGDKAAAIKSYETALKLNPKKTAAEIRDHETTTAALAALR
jgi:predicted negative regulator of RcsB-dependent stress response